MINFKINNLEEKDNQGIFELEPLERGFGHTVGNCLRRVLLSGLEGAAITAVKIDGVSHQFSTIAGVSEDVIEIILNLKKVRIKIFGEQEIKLRIKATGKTEVKAGDIDTLGGGEIANPALHIAFLNTPSAKLSIEMTASKGTGFVMAEEKKSDEIGLMPIDAIYSPVLEVDYKIEPTRVGRSTNFDKLILSIRTDGTIKPADALHSSAGILSNYFRQIYEPAPMPEEVVEQPKNDGVLKMSVEELDLPVRITNALKAVDIDIVEKLVSTPRGQLLKAKNLGVQSLNLISQKLLERGLSLSEA